MKILLWSIGKPHDDLLRSAIENFTHRVSRYCDTEWKVIPSPKNAGKLNEKDLKKKEAEIILSLLDKNDWLVALDEGGKEFTSEGLAGFIEKRKNDRIKNLVFLIGGTYGLEDTVLKKANYRWSLSKLTFPHQLVRLILIEQLYRALTILNNEKYHHK
jgi:23S rRNA (pseudouridine1915-N3)-methyltransferase